MISDIGNQVADKRENLMFLAGAFFTYLCCRCQMGRRPHSHPIGRLEESDLYSHPKRKVTHFTAGVDGGRGMSANNQYFFP